MATELENLKNVCDQIGKALSEKVDSSNPAEIVGKIEALTSLMSSSAYAVGLANKLYARKIMELTEASVGGKLSVTEKKLVFDGKAYEELYFVNLADRQNKGITHAIDGLRSIISYLKQELANLPTN